MKSLYIIAAATAALFLAACGGGAVEGGAPADALVVLGNDCLTRTDVVARMPAGLASADSTALARAYVRQWIEARLIERVASGEIDVDEIDRLTAEYRRQLIMAQYRRAMSQKASDGIFAEGSLRAYYESHSNDFVLERPLLKGVYIKVPDDSPNLRHIKRYYRSESPDDIDRLDKEASGSAVHYDYFRDRWIDWEQIENRIPGDFTAQQIAAIGAGKPFEMSAGGFTYLLSVSDYLPVGSPMPFEAARPLVRERLLTLRRLDYDKQLRNDLLNKAVADGSLVFPGQNPLK